jgi:hypothetical protein
LALLQPSQHGGQAFRRLDPQLFIDIKTTKNHFNITDLTAQLRLVRCSCADTWALQRFGE